METVISEAMSLNNRVCVESETGSSTSGRLLHAGTQDADRNVIHLNCGECVQQSESLYTE